MSIDAKNTDQAVRLLEEMRRVGESSWYNRFYPRKMEVIKDLVRRIEDKKNKSGAYGRVALTESERETLESYRFLDR